MISLRTRIFIVVSLVVLLILGISLFLLWRSKQPVTLATPVVSQPGITTDQTGNGANPLPVTDLSKAKVGKTSSIEVQQKAVQNLAKIFVERYNTFSTEAKYQNIIDLQPLVTTKYWQLLSAKIPKQIPVNVSSIANYTQAFSADISAWSEKQATVDLKVKVTEEKNGVATNHDQQATVVLVKQDNNWLVDSFVWVK